MCLDTLKYCDIWHFCGSEDSSHDCLHCNAM